MTININENINNINNIKRLCRGCEPFINKNIDKSDIKKLDYICDFCKYDRHIFMRYSDIQHIYKLKRWNLSSLFKIIDPEIHSNEHLYLIKDVINIAKKLDSTKRIYKNIMDDIDICLGIEKRNITIALLKMHFLKFDDSSIAEKVLETNANIIKKIIAFSYNEYITPFASSINILNMIKKQIELNNEKIRRIKFMDKLFNTHIPQEYIADAKKLYPYVSYIENKTNDVNECFVQILDFVTRKKDIDTLIHDKLPQSAHASAKMLYIYTQYLAYDQDYNLLDVFKTIKKYVQTHSNIYNRKNKIDKLLDNLLPYPFNYYAKNDGIYTNYVTTGTFNGIDDVDIKYIEDKYSLLYNKVIEFNQKIKSELGFSINCNDKYYVKYYNQIQKNQITIDEAVNKLKISHEQDIRRFKLNECIQKYVTQDNKIVANDEMFKRFATDKMVTPEMVKESIEKKFKKQRNLNKLINNKLGTSCLIKEKAKPYYYQYINHDTVTLESITDMLDKFKAKSQVKIKVRIGVDINKKSK
jgi:hypothetical protein